ncbi:GNAT family N-acetyltransferase [Mesorhizobium sp. NPDC059054]|uniref:GNAT family N-acetyltransferase n=1 Tax=Mesorhizobium sp. NPDC059054 TaxID=3346711 RepID=UPI00369FD6FA
MTVTIERAAPLLFDAAGKADFSFEVDAYLEPTFGTPVSEWRRIPTEPYVKSYGKTDEDGGEWDEDSALFVAMLDDAPVGRLSVTRNWNGYGLLDHFGVDRQHRAGGIGNRLFEQAKSWAREQGLPGLSLETQNNNLTACRFYERQGFQLGGIDRFFYRGLHPGTREIALFWYLPFAPQI